MAYQRPMTATEAGELTAAADPDCPECLGEGFIPICWNNDPGRCEDMVCACVSDDWRARKETA